MEEIRRKTVFAKNSIRSQDETAFEAENWSKLWLSENGQVKNWCAFFRKKGTGIDVLLFENIWNKSL